jgi:hypothetical protein
MQLTAPFAISARLCPALQVGDAWLSYDAGTFVIDFADGSEHRIDDFRPGACADLQSQFAAICGFLYACAEGRQYETRTGRESENGDMFPEHVGAWAESVSDELGLLSYDLETGPALIED